MSSEPEESNCSFEFKGLPNIGSNSCYANTLVQCLSITIPFTKYLLSKDFIKDIDKTKQETLVLLEYYKVLKQLWTPEIQNVNIKRFYERLIQMEIMESVEINEYIITRQQDIFLTFIQLLDNIEKSLKNRETFDSIFYHEMTRNIVCKKCEHSVESTEKNWYLPIQCDDTVENSIFKLFTNERLEDYKCDECKETDCTLEKKLTTFPEIFIIRNELRIENRKKVEIPYELIFVDNDINVYYELYAIAKHIGADNYGHYYAICKHISEDKYYKIDDECVSNGKIEQNGYILFYEKQEKFDWNS